MSNTGGFSIDKINDRWKINFKEPVFIDYYELLQEKLVPTDLNNDKIRIIDALTIGGGLLSKTEGYQWLDSFKSRSTDTIIDSLLKYAALLPDNEAFDTKIQICGILFRFDSVR